MSATDGDLRASYAELQAAFERLSLEKAAAVAAQAAAERAGRLQRLESLRPTALPNVSKSERSRSSSLSLQYPLKFFTQLPPRSGVDGALPGFPTAELEGAVCRAALHAMRNERRPTAPASELALHHPYHMRLLAASCL